MDDATQTTRQLVHQLQNTLLAVLQVEFSNGSNSNCRPLGDVLVYISDGPFGSKLKTAHYSDAGARVVRLQNIGAGEFDNTDKAFVPYDYYEELNRYSLMPGDIVVAGLGDETHAVGRACQTPDTLGPAIHKADCFRLRANSSVISQEYLLWFLNSPNARRQIHRITQGTTRFRVNTTNIRKLHIPVVSFHEQQRIIETVNSVRQSLRAATQAITDKQKLTQELLTHVLG